MEQEELALLRVELGQHNVNFDLEPSRLQINEPIDVVDMRDGRSNITIRGRTFTVPGGTVIHTKTVLTLNM